jgi:hypothetical protein
MSKGRQSLVFSSNFAGNQQTPYNGSIFYNNVLPAWNVINQGIFTLSPGSIWLKFRYFNV